MAQRTRSNWHYVRSIVAQTWRHPSNRHRRVAAVCSAIGWQVRQAPPPAPQRRRLLRVPAALPPGQQLGVQRRVLHRALRRRRDGIHAALPATTGDGFVDVGANIGTYSLLARRLVGPTGRVVAFEPHPVAAARLRENVELNRIDNIEVHEAAVADVAGEAEFLEDFDVSNRIRSATDHGASTRRCRPRRSTRHRAPARLRPRASWTSRDTRPQRCGARQERLAAADPPVWQIEVLDHQLARAGTDRAELIGLLAGRTASAWPPTPKRRPRSSSARGTVRSATSGRCTTQPPTGSSGASPGLPRRRLTTQSASTTRGVSGHSVRVGSTVLQTSPCGSLTVCHARCRR